MKNNLEIDFVAEKSGKKIYLQVTYLMQSEQTRKREFESLLLIKDNFRKILISMDELSGGSYEGIEHIHITDFLLDDSF